MTTCLIDIGCDIDEANLFRGRVRTAPKLSGQTIESTDLGLIHFTGAIGHHHYQEENRLGGIRTDTDRHHRNTNSPATVARNLPHRPLLPCWVVSWGVVSTLPYHRRRCLGLVGVDTLSVLLTPTLVTTHRRTLAGTLRRTTMLKPVVHGYCRLEGMSFSAVR